MKKLIFTFLIICGLASSVFAYGNYGCRPYTPYRNGYWRGYAAGYCRAVYRPYYYGFGYYRPVYCSPIYVAPVYRPAYPVYVERAIEIGA